MPFRPSLSRAPQSPDGDAHPPEDFWSRELLNHTPSLRRLLEPLTLASSHDLTVLLTGETGTGKTYHARLIHEQSRRQHHRLVIVPCGALSPRLLASELFGQVQGALPGTDGDQAGKLAIAGQGTVLLDEVDALGLEEQVKLLRVLQTGEYQPVGGSSMRLCQARIMAASNRDLKAAVLGGRFREDLYCRLSEVVLHLPPLRERTEDIAPLARSIVASFCHWLGKDPLALSPEALAALEAFRWPGNVRQLHNVIQQAVLASTGPELLRQHLPLPFREGAPC
jgi:two-component system response regulator HydG